MEELAFRPIVTLVDQLRRREISPVELLDFFLDRIARLNPKLNAFILLLDEQARQAARESEGRLLRGEARPLEGIPLAIKDNVLLAGTPTTFGSRTAPDTPAPTDAEVVARLRRAGAVFVGKTNLPELGTLPTTENLLFGPTHNPWDLNRTPGGSSGGTAAAVAAGLVPAGHGNDGGGSLRIPAASCGLFTIKPTRGRISTGPIVGDIMGGFVVEGFLTRTVADHALLMDLTSGPAPGDPYWAPEPKEPFSRAVSQDPGSLHIGWTVTPPLPAEVDPHHVRAVEETARLLESLGHHVEPFTPAWQDDELLPSFIGAWAAGIAWHAEILRRQGGKREGLEPHNEALWKQAQSISSSDYLLLVTQLQQYARRVVAAWQTFDVIITPSLAKPPVHLGELFEGTAVNPLAPLMASAAFMPFSPVANITGQPAAQLPLFWENGLPVGIQAIGRQGEEEILYRLAAQLERARPWADRRPPER